MIILVWLMHFVISHVIFMKYLNHAVLFSLMVTYACCFLRQRMFHAKW
jgi:hypothetical protein